MEDKRNNIKSKCQLLNLNEYTHQPSLVERLRCFTLRMLSALERRILRLHNAIREDSFSHQTTESTASKISETSKATEKSIIEEPLSAGTKVQVLSHAEILSTLDEDGKFDGLSWMPAMALFCGKQLYVKRRLRVIYDEGARRMLSIKKGRYILDEAICDGKGVFIQEGCDRCCFFIWSDKWLRRL
jgi:hypothetical protein